MEKLIELSKHNQKIKCLDYKWLIRSYLSNHHHIFNSTNPEEILKIEH